MIELISFGYLHSAPPPADRVVDVRDRLRDPAAARGILDLDGLHPRVQQVVMGTPGAPELIDDLVDYTEFCEDPLTIAIGCAGGKHRAAALAETLAGRLRERGHRVAVTHLHVHLPRVLRPAS